MLTNWSTIQNSIRQLRKIEERLAEYNSGLNKKEILTLTRQRDKLERSLGGIRDMGGKPDLLFIIDTNREELAVKEAQKLGIPIAAIVDTNCSTDGIDFPIPGNDDATRAIKLYCRLISDAALSGLQQSMGGKEIDFGAAVDAAEGQEDGLSERQQQEKLTRENNSKAGKGARTKAAPASSTKKEAFAAEAKKAASKSKKSEEVPFEAATAAATEEASSDAAPKAKKAAKKSA